MICPNCKNFLKLVTINGELKYMCDHGDKYDTTEIDTMVYKKDEKIPEFIPKAKVIANYPVNQKEKKSCINCKYNLVSYITEKNTNTKIYVCCKCYTKWS